MSPDFDRFSHKTKSTDQTYGIYMYKILGKYDGQGNLMVSTSILKNIQQFENNLKNSPDTL